MREFTKDDRKSLKLGAIARAKSRLALAHPEEFQRYYEEEYRLKADRFREFDRIIADINRGDANDRAD